MPGALPQRAPAPTPMQTPGPMPEQRTPQPQQVAIAPKKKPLQY
jgi:hypothetical protein